MLVLAGLAYAVVTNQNLHWHVIGSYLHSGAILSGLAVTLELTVLSMVVGVVLGTVLAVMRSSPAGAFRSLSSLYIWFFRGTPLLVQLIFWFNIALIFPSVGAGSAHISTNTLVTPFIAAVLGLGLNEGAYMAEIIRGGIQSIDRGQTEAAYSVGLTPWQAMRKVILPQALRVIVPPTGNQVIGMLKTTSLVSVIAAQDLLTAAENIYAKTFEVIDLLIVASIWYLVLTTVASVGQVFIERRLGAGTLTLSTRESALPGLLSTVRRNLVPRRAAIDPIDVEP